jgi:uncharacterized protein YgiM (DUF1202 family)
MGLIDWIKNRGQQPAEQPSQQQQPEVSQNISDRTSSEKTVGQLPENVRSEARELGAKLDQATRNIQTDAPASPQAPADATDNQQPMRQNMVSQDNPAPALSPTSAQDGVPMKDVEGPEAPAATPRPTIARTTPSWER